MFTAAYAYRKGINPVEFTRVVQWVQFKFESPVDNELCVPDVEYSDYGTVLEDYQHFSTARIVYLIYKDYIEELILKNSVNKFNFDEKRQEINSWREQYLSKLLTLKRPLGGSLIEPHSRLYTWATAQALLALITARNWHKLNSIETLDIKSIPKISVPVVKVADKFVSKILHISDLHFTAEAKTKVWYNQLENEVKENINLKQSHGLAEKWFNQLDQDIKNNLNCQTIDILIISGDIADKSTPEEYVAAKIFIEKVCDNFQIGTKQRVIVPGNHDLNWEISEKAFHLVRRKNYRGEIRPEIDIDRGSDVVEIRSEEIYLQRFEHFQRFYKNITESDYPENYDEQGIIHYFPDSKLLILGLNSAWNQDHHYKERAGINTITLAKVLPLIRGNPEYTDCLKIAVWHHPVTGQEMMDYEFMDLLANDGFQVCLHGHIHQAIEDFRKYDDNRGLHIIGAGTFGAPTKQQVSGIPLQYNLLVLDPQNQQITVNTRKKEKIDGSWSADARWGDKNNPSPRYTIEYDSRKKTDESSSQPQLTSADSSAVNPPNSQQDILSHVTVYGNLTVGDINQISGDSR
jgi:predicted MPP superfamily phosphohydrolase